MSFVPGLYADLQSLAPTVEILSDEDSPRFQEHAIRWSDIDRKIPAAILLPKTEEDIQTIVRWCLKSSVPFVTRGAGHSEWSTIDKSGIIIDLRDYKSIEVHANEHKAVLRGSVPAKDLAMTLAPERLFAAVGNGNGVGVIAFMLNGGVSVTNQITGYGSDQILAARVINARGDLIEVDEKHHPDLLWALRGAGQFFGLVTELVIRVHPFEALGNSDGLIWSGAFVFPTTRAAELASVMQVIMNDERYQTAGLMMVTSSPPPARQPSLVVAARYTGNPADAETAYRLLYDLKPLVANGRPMPIQNATDGRAEIGDYGDFKRFSIAGLLRFDEESFLAMIEVYNSMVAECPDTAKSAFMFQWESNLPKRPAFDSATSLHGTRFWQNNLVWHTNEANREKVDEYDGKCIALMRGPNEDEWQDYQNATRTGPIERRFRPAEKLNRLRELKKVWDPEGVFTRQLLD